MMKLILPIAAIALITSVAAAAAAETTGEITAVDSDTRTITLADGETYRLGPSVDRSDLRRHWDVKVAYDVVNGRRVARDVTMMPGPYPDNAPGEDNPAAD